MVLTQSGAPRLGEPVPNFELPDATKPGMPRVSLYRNILRIGAAGGTAPDAPSAADATPRPKAALVCWLCVHCPFVVLLKPALASLAREYAAKGVAVAAVSSNSPAERAQDGPEGMAADASDHGFFFPYLFDGADQAAARAWGAACTPEFFVVGGADGRTLLYHGRFDAARPGNGAEPTGEDLRRALDAALEPGGGRALPAEEQRRAIGCSIKWTGGEAPAFAAALAVPK